MLLPLYDALAANPPKRNSGNAGLWYDKFCNRWRRGNQNEAAWTLEVKQGRRETNPKLDWINTVCDGKIGTSDLLIQAYNRSLKLIGTFNASPVVFKTTSRFVTGLGREHPIENGFAWHHTLGVPYLPGSSVKGMVHGWVKHWLAAHGTSIDNAGINRVFGDTRRNGAGAGSVIFFDAIPTEPVKLEPDVMTPHYDEYYKELRRRPLNHAPAPPADWYSPIPIPFLTVASNQSFLFAVMPSCADAIDDCKQGRSWLIDALANIGAGAKTAVGYGRFELDQTATAKAERTVARQRQEDADVLAAAADPLLGFKRWFDEQNFSDRNKDKHNSIIKEIQRSADPAGAKAYVKSRMRKNDCTTSLWSFLSQPSQ